MTYHRLKTKYGDRFYREAGAGEPIVLLHCSSGSSGAWPTVMEHLGECCMSPLTRPVAVATAIGRHVESVDAQCRSAA